jgi:hypothetical protein
VIPWTLLDKAAVPGGGELRLMRRGTEFSIKLGQNEPLRFAFANARSVAMKRSTIGTISLAGAVTGCPVMRPGSSAYATRSR